MNSSNHLKDSEQRFRLIVDSIPSLVCTMTAGGEVEFVNQQILDYTGKTLEELRDWQPLVHPDDLALVMTLWMRSVKTGDAYEVEHRILRADGVYRWFHVRGLALRDTERRIVRWYNLFTDIDERRRAEEKVRRSEAYFSEAQRLSHTGSFAWDVSTGEIYSSAEMFRIFEYDRAVKPTFASAFQRIHPDDTDLVQQTIDHASNERTNFDIQHRLLMPDRRVKHVHVVARALETSSGSLEFVGAVTDVTAAKEVQEALRQSESYLADAQRLTHTGSWAWEVAGGHALHLSEEWYRIYGFDPEEGLAVWKKRLQRIHPEDLAKWQEATQRAVRTKSDYEVEARVLLPDSTVKYIHTVGHPVLNASGDVVQFMGSSIDISASKRAENTLRRSEESLLEAQRLSHTGSWRHDVPTESVIVSPEVYRIYGIRPDDDASNTEFFFSRFHPEDRQRVVELFEKREKHKTSFQVDYRIVLPDGTIKRLHSIGHPVVNEAGDLVEFVGTTMDVTEQWQARAELEKAFEEIKHLKDRLQNENVALREEIDRASMFEEIVGISPALHAVLSRLSKVAPTDSTVLITGETGTGKELIARAVHKRSQRYARAFVSVNCAAIPHELIASELFGHEKGAFTGATQRRLGRFELAEGGTIFLDEVGELPAETQIALLRVLQEHEFERVGGTGSIRTNVRVIAATNRDLEAAIAASTFRSDLFYRLNVFPIEVPPLRERREDIPVLVEYFIDRYARKAGKSFEAVSKKSLDLLYSYPWPGNIRELQNVIERSVIVCETENFSVDGSWLSRQPLTSELKSPLELSRKLAAQEKEMIEGALRGSRGRVSGPSGAAAKLGMPGSTLESKIRLLKINKNQFKTTANHI
jgi:PAS domain S-box-containing protein